MSSIENTLTPNSSGLSTDPKDSNRRRLIRMWLSFLLVLFSALNLRPLLTSVAPLLKDIQADLALSNVWISVLMTLPVICLGVFGPLAAPLSKRFGLEGVLLVAMFAMLVGGVVRSFGHAPLYLGTILVGGGVSLLGILAPVLIKRDFPDKVGLMMGLFAMMLGLGAAASTAFAVPVTEALGGGWQLGLAFWMVPLAPTALIALARLATGDKVRGQAVQPKFGIMHDPVSWQVMGFFALFASLA